MRPTGKLHLGNYIGALSNWVKLQDEYDCFYMIADLHALTTEYKDTSQIRENKKEMLLDFLACGLDPKKSTIFIQSEVPEHSQLHFLLSVITPLAWVERCPTFKEQLVELKNKEIATYGFLGYPVLQAADILLYKADRVPVGEDQLPHLEIAREIARRFNFLYQNVFPEPQPIFTEVKKLVGIDGRKMSKSYNNSIYLCDEPELIKKKINKMITDPAKIYKGDKGNPQVCTVYSYHKIFSPEFKEIEKFCKEGSLLCTDCKGKLSCNLIKILTPVQEKRKELSKKKDNIQDVLNEGKEKAKKIAGETINQVYKAMKF